MENMASNLTCLSEEFFKIVNLDEVSLIRDRFNKFKPPERNNLVNLFNENGETPLLIAIKLNNHEMANLFINEWNASISQTGTFSLNGLFFSQVPPLFASLIGERRLWVDLDIPKLLIAAHLENGSPDQMIQSVMLSSATNQEKVDILELVGAAFILSDKAQKYGLQCWKESSILRNSVFDENDQFESMLMKDLFGRNIEEQFSEVELREIILSNRWQPKYKQLRMQAFVIAQRFMERYGPYLNIYFLIAFKFFCCEFKNEYGQRFLLEFYIRILQRLEKFHDDGNEFLLEWRTVETIKLTLSVFYDLSEADRVEFGEFIMKSLCNCFTSYRSLCLRAETLNKFMESRLEFDILYEILFVSYSIFTILELLNDNEKRRFRCWMRNLLALEFDPLKSNMHSSFLHEAISIKSDEFIQFLLSCGASPHAVDKRGHIPLHLVCNNNLHYDIFYTSTVKLLIEAGSHIDLANDYGYSPLDVFRFLVASQKSMGLRINNYLVSLINPFLPLKCLCANEVVRSSLVYEHILPKILSDFVKRHGEKSIPVLYESNFDHWNFRVR